MSIYELKPVLPRLTESDQISELWEQSGIDHFLLVVEGFHREKVVPEILKEIQIDNSGFIIYRGQRFITFKPEMQIRDLKSKKEEERITKQKQLVWGARSGFNIENGELIPMTHNLVSVSMDLEGGIAISARDKNIAEISKTEWSNNRITFQDQISYAYALQEQYFEQEDKIINFIKPVIRRFAPTALKVISRL